jgi:hypothetical protein
VTGWEQLEKQFVEAVTYMGIRVREPNLFLYKYTTFSTPVVIHTYLSMNMEQTECSKILALKLQMPVNNTKESIQQLYLALV